MLAVAPQLAFILKTHSIETSNISIQSRKSLEEPLPQIQKQANEFECQVSNQGSNYDCDIKKFSQKSQ